VTHGAITTCGADEEESVANEPNVAVVVADRGYRTVAPHGLPLVGRRPGRLGRRPAKWLLSRCRVQLLRLALRHCENECFSVCYWDVVSDWK